jgi:glutathione S-transferase
MPPVAGEGTSMDVKLFGSRLSPFVEKVARGLQLKHIEFALIDVKSPMDFKRWNPQTGKMPVLEVDGERVFDSTAILRRLDELVPEPSLHASDPATYARQRFIEDWSDESLYWYVMGCRWTDVNAEASAAQVVDTIPLPAFAKPLIRIITRRQIGGQATAQGLVRLPFEHLLDELGRRLDELLVFLGDRPFFFSDSPSVADLAIFGQLRALQSGPTPQGARLVDERPALVQYVRRVDEATRPGARKPRLAAAS